MIYNLILFASFFFNDTTKCHIVTATTYSLDNKGLTTITASGIKINEKNPYGQRIIAVSRDLKKQYKYGQKVMIKGTGEYDGIYYIRDLMNKRWKNRIDILINNSQKDGFYENVKICIL